MPYQEPHYSAFSKLMFKPQGAVGYSPSQWAKDYGLDDVPHAEELPATRLCREQVRSFCRDQKKPVLFGYICAMAWGGQSDGPGGRRNTVNAWSERRRIADQLKALRDGGLSRKDSYNLFRGKGRIPHLGPSFFTKLIYFFSPVKTFYIMDQWTGKSINLLTGQHVVRVNGAADAANKGGNYQAFCEEVDRLAAALPEPGVHSEESGERMEERLFSRGRENNGMPPALWRAYVQNNYAGNKPPRYNRNALHQIYPHISVNDF